MNYRKIWTDHHGYPIPKGYHIHHIDGDHNNNEVSNLHACSVEEHASLHKEMGQPWAANLILKQHRYLIDGDQHPLFGKSHSQNTKDKISKTLTGSTASPETKAKMSVSHRGRVGIPHSEESKKLIGEKSRLKKGMTYHMNAVTCPHCSVTGKGGNMGRYHFNNCKHKE